MKKGDKVICIKPHVKFKVNDTYKIVAVLSHIYVINGKGFNIKTEKGYYNFDEYFISIKEQRKLKLDKINKINV
jgi:hypothetical protein